MDRLYERIAEDPLLQPLFGGRVRGEHLNQKRFFEEWAGGEPRYRRAGVGSGMYLLHYRFGIDRKRAGRWLHHLVKAMREENLPQPVVQEIARILGPMAHAMRNDDGPPLPPALRGASTRQLRDALVGDPELIEHHRGEMRRLLFRAAECGDVERIEILASEGVPVNLPFLRSGLMLTPWCAAELGGHGQAAQVLLDHGALVDVFSAAFLGKLELLAQILDDDPGLVDVEDPAMDMRGIQPLHHAVGGGRPEAAELLLRRGATMGPDSGQLLRSAADAGWLGVAELMVEAGARCEDVGPGPWVLDPEISSLLLGHGVDVNQPPGAWLSFCTARFGQRDDPQLVRRLIELGVDTEAREADAGPLHLAAKAGHAGVLTELLSAGLEVDTLRRIR